MPLPPPFRPTFDVSLAAPIADVVEALGAVLASEPDFPHQMRGPHVVVSIPPARRRFWSPFLTLEVQSSESGVVLHGRFSPQPAIWTGFMLAYIALTTAACFALMLGASQAIIGRPPSGAALALPLIALGIGLYVASQVGQRMAGDQMEELRALVSRAIAPFAGPADGALAPPAGLAQVR